MSVAVVAGSGPPPGRAAPSMPRARTVPALLGELAEGHPDVEFIVGAGRRLRYPEFRDEARRFACALHALGVRRGDKVAILMGNRPEWLIAYFAILSLGAVMVSLNTWATRRELAYMLDHSDTSVLVTVDRFLGQDYTAALQEIGAAAGLPRLRHIVRLAPDGRTLPGGVSWEAALQAGMAVPESTVDAAEDAIEPADVGCILYTSGSTSTPKGVQLQHFALIENMWHIGERQRLRAGDRLWLAVSLFWGLGCENALFALMTHAGTIVLQERFEAGEAIDLIERERCTVVYATPNMVRALAEHPGYRRERLASLRTGVTIGTPEQVRLLADLGASEICNVYGLTETYGNCTVTDAQDPMEVRAASVGRPLPGFELAIVDPKTRRSLPAGEVGEIKARGYVTCGYYRDEDRNREAFDDEGWFLTGDLGYLDDSGRLHYRGRLKEMIKTGGINVAPVEVEEVLMSHPGVEQAFVVGLPDAERDEIVVAAVVPREGSGVDEATLREHSAGALAAYKRPRRYRLVAAEELPLTTTGKVRKLGMKELFEAGAGD
ncbi:MAG: AMP-binding protein [Immundisolibacterales bacterium]|nr:AMP-binding protein [Immundisolibacterales bacterium]